jgi:tol-pal system protein YbgF
MCAAVYYRSPDRRVRPMLQWKHAGELCGAIALFAGCAGSMKQVENEALLPEIDVVQVKENSDEALKLAQEAKLDVDVLSTKLTEIDNKIVMLSDEISSVSSAKIEELENRLALLVEAYKDLQAQVRALEATPRTAKAKVDPTFAPSSASGILAASTEYESYQNGLRSFNARNYEQAVKIFNDVIKQYPSGSYTDNSHYWIGECHYAQGDFASAIASFQKVLSFENSSKADDAQLKTGMSYLKMGQTGPARTELKRLIDRYPSSEYIPRAKKYLDEMK